MKKEKKEILAKTMLLTLVTGIFLMAGINYFVPTTDSQQVTTLEQVPTLGEAIPHGGAFCVSVNDEEPECHHNVLTNAGEDHMLLLLKGDISSSAFDYIAIGNTTTPVAGSTTLAGEQTADGLQRINGTDAVTGASGSYNVSVWYQFTYTGASSRVVNTTMLFNASSAGTAFIGDNFTSRTLETNDKINISAYYWGS